jgi:hypothetical protein
MLLKPSAHRRAARLAALGAVALLGACADRGVAAGPSTDPGLGTWATVTFAAVLATVVLAAIIVLPAQRPGGSVVGSWVLGLQAAGLVVAVVLLVGAAVRSVQLLDRPPDAEQAASLVRLSGIDGDTGLFQLIALVTVVLGGLLVAALVLAARFAADVDLLERTLATVVLGAEVLASLGCWVLLVLGFRHLGFVLPALALPVLVVAMVATWPRARSAGSAGLAWG